MVRTEPTWATLARRVQASCGYGYRAVWEGYAAECRSDDPRPIAWCRDFLGPYFPSRRGSGQLLLSLWITQRRPDVAPPSGKGEAVALFLGARGLRFWLDRNVALVVEEERRNTYLVMPRRIVAWLAGGDDEVRVPARLIREALVNAQVQRGAVRVHGGIGHVDDAAYLIVGASGSGKTATILSFIRAGDRHFCGHDRVVLTVRSGQPLALGVPIYSQVGVDLIGWFPRLAASVAAAAGEEIALHDPGGCGFAKRSISPQQFVDALKLRVVPRVRVRGVIVPALTDLAGMRPQVSLVPASQRRHILQQSILSPDPAFPPTLFLRTRPSRSIVSTVAAILDLPWIALRGWYQDEGLAEAIRAYRRPPFRRGSDVPFEETVALSLRRL